MNTKKFKGFIVTDALPKTGDTIVCINKKSIHYGFTEIATHIEVKNEIIDCKNWKVVVNVDKRKEAIIDDVIESIKKDIAQGDLTILGELLNLIPEKNLIQSLSEDEWKKYSKIKNK